MHRTFIVISPWWKGWRRWFGGPDCAKIPTQWTLTSFPGTSHRPIFSDDPDGVGPEAAVRVSSGCRIVSSRDASRDPGEGGTSLRSILVRGCSDGPTAVMSLVADRQPKNPPESARDRLRCGRERCPQ